MLLLLLLQHLGSQHTSPSASRSGIEAVVEAVGAGGAGLAVVVLRVWRQIARRPPRALLRLQSCKALGAEAVVVCRAVEAALATAHCALVCHDDDDGDDEKLRDEMCGVILILRFFTGFREF